MASGQFTLYAQPPIRHEHPVTTINDNETVISIPDATNAVPQKRRASIIPNNTFDPSLRETQKYKQPTIWEAIKRGLWKFFYFPIYKRGLQLFFAVAWFAMCLYWNALIQVWVQRFVIINNYLNAPPLLDLGYFLLPYISTSSLSDIYMTVMIVVVIVKTFLFQGVSRGLHVVRRWLFIHGICWCLRAVSIAITMLPNPYTQCVPPTISNYWINAFLVATSYEVTCSDLFFSGHTIMMSLATCIWFTYTSSRYVLVRLLIVPVLLGGVFVLISTHFHYTVDVFYGISIGFILWGGYHYIARTIERWLVERLYREYVIRQRAPEYKDYAEEDTSYWNLAGEFLSQDEGKDTLMIVKKKIHTEEQKEADQEPHRGIAFIVIENSDVEATVGQRTTQVEGEAPNPSQQKVLEKLHRKIHKVKQRVRDHSDRLAYYENFKQAVVTALLHFMIWFESWDDYVHFNFDTVEIERVMTKYGHNVPKHLDDNTLGVTQ